MLEAAHAELKPTQALVFEVLAATGCRISEALGLQFRDLRGDRLTFSRTWSKARQVEPMKSATSRRTLAVPAKLGKLINAERERRGAQSDGFIFDARNGAPYDQNNVRKRLLPTVILAAGVPSRTLHEIRHSHAVLLLEADTPIKVVQLRLATPTRRPRSPPMRTSPRPWKAPRSPPWTRPSRKRAADQLWRPGSVKPRVQGGGMPSAPSSCAGAHAPPLL